MEHFFISQNYYTATTAHTSGPPNSGLIPNSIAGSAGLTYQLASYSANNSLRLQGVNSGSVMFATAASVLQVMAVSIGTYLACLAMPTAVATAATTTSSGTTALTSACALLPAFTCR